MPTEVKDGKLYVSIPGALITVRGEPDKTVPDTQVIGPTYLKWKYTKQIDSISQKDTENGATRDRAAMFDALVKAFAEQAMAGSRIPDHQGNPIPFALDVVDEHAHTEAIAMIAYDLALFFGYLVIDVPFDESAEGNDLEEETPKKPRKLRATAT